MPSFTTASACAVRARSFTELDQRRGEAVCWSRLSYYAGLSPSKGLTFSGDTAVYPLRIGPGSASMDRQKPSPMEMEWVEAEPNAADPLPSQHFSSDWLPARVPTQFVTVRARKTAARLNVIVGPQGRHFENRESPGRTHSFAGRDRCGGDKHSMRKE